MPTPQFLTDFAATHSTANEDSQLERSWFFEAKDVKPPDSSRGYVRYGTYGFESDFVDTKTKTHNYRRKTTDVELIPLFYGVLAS